MADTLSKEDVLNDLINSFKNNKSKYSDLQILQFIRNSQKSGSPNINDKDITRIGLLFATRVAERSIGYNVDTIRQRIQTQLNQFNSLYDMMEKLSSEEIISIIKTTKVGEMISDSKLNYETPRYSYKDIL